MYTIYRLKTGKFQCCCRIQDGTERWICATEEDAIQSLLDSSKILNGVQITRDDIHIFDELPPEPLRLTPEEHEMILKFRNGSLIVVSKSQAIGANPASG
jgi:hypothetical protein